MVPLFFYVLTFSGMGYGRDGYRFATINGELGFYCLFGSFCTFLALYVLDCSYWTSVCMRAIRSVFMLLGVVAFITGIFFSAGKYPYTPLLTFMMLTPPRFKIQGGYPKPDGGGEGRTEEILVSNIGYLSDSDNH